MSAQPAYEPDPDDPVEILRVLPEQYHGQFLSEYRAAVQEAWRPEQYRKLHELLRLWRLRARAYADPGYEERRAAAKAGRPEDHIPAEQVIPGWANRHPRR